VHNNEDYLDNLLNNVTSKLSEFDEDYEQRKQMEDAYMKRKNLPPKTMRALESVRENQFLREFEEELKADKEAGLLEAYEAELNRDVDEFERSQGAGSDTDDFGQNEMAALLKEQESEDWDIPGEEPEASAVPDAAETAPSQEEMPELPEGMEGLKDLFDDIGMDADAPAQDMASMDGETEEPLPADEEQLIPEDGELSDDDILSLLGGSEDEELSDIGKMLEADEQSISLEDISADPENLAHAADMAESRQPKEADSKKKKPKKSGFLAKLMDLLFGEDEEEEIDPQSIEGMNDLEHISDENMEILRAMSGEDQAEAGAAGKKKKKKEKKEKKPKEKKEKKPKEKKAKPPKEKKEKKPKEKGKPEKPLPKVPVILIAVIAISLFALIYLGTNLIGHSTFISAAEREFDKGNYVDSYGELNGMELSDSEVELYERSKVLAGVQTELNAYYSLMDVRKFDLALDSLVRALGRSDLHMTEAEEWDVTAQMNTLVDEIEKQLMDQFNVTPEQARELYDIDDREEYSLALDEVLTDLGLSY
jgi:hypothetical protein